MAHAVHWYTCLYCYPYSGRVSQLLESTNEGTFNKVHVLVFNFFFSSSILFLLSWGTCVVMQGVSISIGKLVTGDSVRLLGERI